MIGTFTCTRCDHSLHSDTFHNRMWTVHRAYSGARRRSNLIGRRTAPAHKSHRAWRTSPPEMDLEVAWWGPTLGRMVNWPPGRKVGLYSQRRLILKLSQINFRFLWDVRSSSLIFKLTLTLQVYLLVYEIIVYYTSSVYEIIAMASLTSPLWHQPQAMCKRWFLGRTAQIIYACMSATKQRALGLQY